MGEEGEVWVGEYLTPSDRVVHRVRRIIVHRQTTYQDLKIVESPAFGKALMLDSTWQSSTLDEFIYHESLVHPAMFLHGSPRRVLILGGGEGATAREVLRWNTVERVVMVDIDGEVVDACREHLSEMHQGSFDDPRLELVIGDALELLDTTREAWDVVISDLSDPIEHGPSYRLFTREYFHKAKRVVAPGGSFVVQAGSISPVEIEIHARLHRTVADAFESVATYSAFVPSFGTPWSFIVATDRELPTRPSPEQTDALLGRHVDGRLRHIDGASAMAAFVLPPHVRRAIADERRVYTLDDPPRFGAGLGS